MQQQPMSDDRFWQLIDATIFLEDQPDEQLAALERSLARLKADEIVAFELAFGDKLRRSYRWDLWGAAYVVHGGCSDDGFEYFRRWLISKGSEVYKSVTSHPDDLAGLHLTAIDGIFEFEEFVSAASDAWAEVTGKDPYDDDSGFPFGSGEMTGTDPVGTPFSEDEASLARNYPKLWERYGQNPLPHE